jgi:hypothetical protein
MIPKMLRLLADIPSQGYGDARLCYTDNGVTLRQVHSECLPVLSGLG